MTGVHNQFGRAMTSTEYAEEWERSAEAFYSCGHYGWMNQQLGEAKRVFEIGCGSGASTEILASLDRQVLSVDSNTNCIQSAQARLQSKEISSATITLQQCNSLSNWTGEQVKLLQADILNIDIYEYFPVEAFDAVVCWMIGSYPEHVGNHTGQGLSELDGSSMANYRVLTHKWAYELGRRVLTTSGLVHIVDRAEISSWNDKTYMRNELAKTHTNLASPGYEVTQNDCFLRKLTQGLNYSSIQYVVKKPPDFQGVLVLTSSKAKRI